MSTYHANVTWARGADAFLHQKYSRGHRWTFDEGVSIAASASPQAVRAPLAAEFDAMHHRAHEQCYVANSIRGAVAVEPVMRTV